MIIKIYNRSFKLHKEIIYVLLILLIIFVNFSISDLRKRALSYSIFIEFENAHGIKFGTSVRFRGFNIGHVVDIYYKLNNVLIMVNIKSNKYLIPRNSLVETNQIGLLNDTVIDIWPLTKYKENNQLKINPLSLSCVKSAFVCHLSCIQGNRGLNYDDLIRSTTRISQRFDDPRLFNFIYLLCYNGMEISDNMLNISASVLDLLHILYHKFK